MKLRQPKIEGIAAPLPRANIDTDQIIPKAHLISVSRDGLGKGLFSEWRYREDGSALEEFVLNRDPWRKAPILLAGPNFGCGSSREHAVWALQDFGFRAVIAPGFASIFYENAFKNGFAPVIVAPGDAERLMQAAQATPGLIVSIDLEAARVRAPGIDCPFEMEAARRRDLIDGIDEIGATLNRAPDIDAFLAADRNRRPWIYSLASNR